MTIQDTKIRLTFSQGSVVEISPQYEKTILDEAAGAVSTGIPGGWVELKIEVRSGQTIAIPLSCSDAENIAGALVAGAMIADGVVPRGNEEGGSS